MARRTKKRGWQLGQKLWKEMFKGRVYECPLNHYKSHLFGYCKGKDVYLDPRTIAVAVLLHELLHRLKPKWSENRVETEAKHVLACLSEKEKTEWWLAYEVLKRNHKTVKIRKE